MFASGPDSSISAFVQNIASFPTAIYTVLLGVVLLYWLGAVLGFIDLDVLDINLDTPDPGGSASHAPSDIVAGLLLRFGLIGPGAAGVPVVVTLSMLILIGWLLCYYTVHFLFGSALGHALGLSAGQLLRYVAGVPVFFVSLVLAALTTAQLIRPLKGLFRQPSQQSHKRILGQTAIVRTSRVDAQFGEVTLEDGGAGLVLKVRSLDGNTFARGDRVVLLDRLDDGSSFSVISEKEFRGY